PLSRDKGLTFTLDISPAVRQWLRGDHLRIRQVLNFLMVNAFKFTAEGGVALRVYRQMDDGTIPPDKRLSAGESSAADVLVFEVKDSGIGIAPERQTRIFDIFVQADDSLTRASGGAGMGLAVSKKLLDLMGGLIYVESVPNEGSAFRFALELPEAKQRRTRGPAAKPLSEAELKGHTAILADDNEINRLVLNGYMSHWGIKSHAFENGFDVIDFLEKNPGLKPDVFLMDSIMPGMTRKELEKRLGKKHPDVPLIFLASDGAEDYISDDGAANAATLPKPVSHNALQDCLAHLLGHAREMKAGQSASQSEKAANAALTKTKKPRIILVVDDNQLNQKLAAALLTKRGHMVSVADNGLEALAAISRTKYDMVLMDIQMPVMDGLTAVKKIREEPDKYGADLPVVAMTAHALPGDQETFLNAGMTGYVSKPFKPQELIAAAEQEITVSDDSGEAGGNIVAAELDKAAILENFMDDEELLFESIDLFLERIATRMDTLKAAVNAKDPEVYMPEAHTIKGMIGIFSTEGPFEAAKKLELKGREKITDGIAEDFGALEKELNALIAALRDWRSPA
ncbi:MAG: response regulator, partial [Candidatus Adiutrix sp.]|nr:response regulator [Candidatus Adiutrix sp.]